jgi:acyl-CoA synthetase (AMP-forming)/AMP-acid ligase II
MRPSAAAPKITRLERWPVRPNSIVSITPAPYPPRLEARFWPSGVEARYRTAMTGAHTVPAVLEAAAERFRAAEALVDGDRRLTFSDLREAALEAAAALVATGVEAGDRIAIWGPNSAEWAIAALGVYCAGASVVPLNTRFKGAEASYILGKSGARLLFTVTDFLDTDYTKALTDAVRVEGDPEPALEATVVWSGPVPPSAVAWDDFLVRGGDGDRATAVVRSEAVTADDTSDILFTSGTTGKPKGAMLRHGASVRAYTDWGDVVGLREGDRYLVINPFFHAFGLKAGVLASLIKGATIVPHKVFDVPSVMQRVDEEGITMLPGPPAIYQTMLDHPELDQFDLSTLRLAVTGAAPVPVEMIKRMRSELTFETIVTGYGLTESTGIATMCRHDDDPETISSTAGRAIPDTEVAISGPDGTRVRAGEAGEVLVRGYHVMKGYFDDPDATASAIDDDGWLHTGDVGVLDDRGNLRITDRIKDLFIVGGFNTYPAEIENIMMANPTVGQVAVVGIPDHRMGEVGAAFVVPRVETTVEPEDLIAWCREHMANYKVPRRVEVVDALPLNASGKVLKYELRARLDG